jgi:hypothetical protein
MKPSKPHPSSGSDTTTNGHKNFTVSAGEVAIVEKLGQVRAQYAREWGGGNARHFRTHGHYAWMAGFLDGHLNVLEIGTGNGTGTLALLSAGHVVVGIDENPECLKLAEANLSEAGFQVIHEKRELIRPTQRGYTIQYRAPQSSHPANGALLLEGDILNDPALLDWIDNNNKAIDAITCWLIGTYYERTYNAVVTELAITSPESYRMTVHKTLCSIADRLLPSGGILHFVDRGDMPHSDIAQQRLLTYYMAQGSGTTLSLVSLSCIPYQEPGPDAGPAIQMITPIPGKEPEPAGTAFISAVFRKG